MSDIVPVRVVAVPLVVESRYESNSEATLARIQIEIATELMQEVSKLKDKVIGTLFLMLAKRGL